VLKKRFSWDRPGKEEGFFKGALGAKPRGGEKGNNSNPPRQQNPHDRKEFAAEENRNVADERREGTKGVPYKSFAGERRGGKAKKFRAINWERANEKEENPF